MAAATASVITRNGVRTKVAVTATVRTKGGRLDRFEGGRYRQGWSTNRRKPMRISSILVCLVLLGCNNGGEGKGPAQKAEPNPQKESVEWSTKELVEFLNQKGVKCKIISELTEKDEVTTSAGVIFSDQQEETLNLDKGSVKLPKWTKMIGIVRATSEQAARARVGAIPNPRAFIWGRFVVVGGEESELWKAIKQVLEKN
jgi:hypothetical protein